MTSDALTHQWSVGRSRDNDVVVDAVGVRDAHCVIRHRQGVWSVAPQQGMVGIAMAQDANIDWFDQPRTFSANDSLYLIPDVRLPWPSDTGAVARLTIGRAVDNDIVIDNAVISGRHAMLVVGPRETVVIRDLDSRNGLFVDGDLNRRISAALLLPQSQVFLGSLAVDVQDLLRQAGRAFDVHSPHPAPPVSAPPMAKTATDSPQVDAPPVSPSPVSPPPSIKVASSATKRPPKPAWLPLAKTVLSAVVPGVLVLGCWWMFLRPGSPPTPEPLTDTSPAVIATGTTASVDTSASQSPTSPHEPPTQEVPATEATEEPLVPATDPRDSLYWILVRHGESGDRFRLGTGVAVAPDRVLTTASIISSMEDMQGDGYVDAAVVQVATGQRRKTQAHHISEEFKKRTRVAAQLVAQYENLLQQLDSEQDDAAEIRATIDKQAKLVNVAMAATAAVDVGWLQVDTLPDFLPADTAHAFRPSQRITSLSAGFDIHDPYYDAEGSANIQQHAYQVQSVGARLRGVPDALKLRPPASADLQQYLVGSPLIHDNHLVGMIVFQDNETGRFEAVRGPVLALDQNPSTTTSPAHHSPERP